MGAKMTKQFVILVNPSDHQIGKEEKILAHQHAMLHRAFSVFIFRERHGQTELLLQQRSKKKYHGGGLWTNTCCSHPRPKENLLKSAEKRLKEEMGITVKLKKKGVFHYVAKLNNGLYENEIDHVFVGTYEDNKKIPINRKEVDNYRWVEVKKLKRDLIAHPKKYSPWLKQALALALGSNKRSGLLK